MPTFRYKAVAQSGESVTGVVQAENQAAALRAIDEKALFPISVEEGGGASESVVSGRKRKLKLRHQTNFYSQLADLLKAGVPLLRSLEVLNRQSTSPILTEVLRDVREDVSSGVTLADAMAKHPHAFAGLHVTMVRAGESGGFLEDVLNRIAIFSERQDELRNKLVGSMIYPCILLFAGTVIVIFLMAFVVPELRKYIKAENFNALSVIVFSLTDLILGWYPLILTVIGGALLGSYLYLQTDGGKIAFDRLKLKMPMLGQIITMVAVCRFCRILGTLLGNGVPILQALEISKGSAGNRVLSDRIGEAAENVQKGETLSKPLGKSGIFPQDVITMMAVAEESNNLENVLVQIAEDNEARTARKIDLGVRLLEPILLLGMGVVVLCIALALLLPILTMSSGM